MRVAVDAMGGDFAPQEIVCGSLAALDAEVAREIVLVGRQDEVKQYLPDQVPRGLSLVDAEQVVEMDEAPAQAVRKKRNSSIVRAVEQIRTDQADALVTAGHTGAAVAACLLHLKRIPGIKRPGIAVDLPTPHGSCLVIDAGANLAAKPIHLFHYGVMGSLFVQTVRGEARPPVGLLSIGAERSKGNDLVKKTMELFQDSDLEFIGPVEGEDIFAGRASVVVCEGFVGNVLLKVSEGVARSSYRSFTDRLASRYPDYRTDDRLAGALEEFERWSDFSEYGGAPLLGIQATCLVCHGKSDRRSIQRAIGEAAAMADSGVAQAIQQEIGTKASHTEGRIRWRLGK